MLLRSLRRRLYLQYLFTVGLLVGLATGALYVLFLAAGERELDIKLRKEISRLAAAVELEPDRPHIDGRRSLEREHLENSDVGWQILLADGSTLARSPLIPAEVAELPPVGGNGLALGRIDFEDAIYGNGIPVRAARMLVVRERQTKATPAKKAAKSKAAGKRQTMPEQMIFDLRAVVDRTALASQQQQFGWQVLGALGAVLAGGALGGVYLIRRAVRPVEQTYERERRFTGAASHELRTPLTALRGEVELALRRDRAPAEYVAALKRIEELTARMTAMVDGLLVLARARAAQLTEGVAEVSVTDLRQAVEEMVRLLPGQERVSVVCSADEKIRLAGDRLLLSLAVRNLVENSLRYAADSPVSVELRLNEVGWIYFGVRDAGPGLPSHVLTGTQAEAAASSNGKPTGLGLSIARAIAESHGGRLDMKNHAVSGCEVAIALPCGGSAGRGVNATPTPADSAPEPVGGLAKGA